MSEETAKMLTEMLSTNFKSTKNWVKKQKHLPMEEFEVAVKQRYQKYKEKKA